MTNLTTFRNNRQTDEGRSRFIAASYSIAPWEQIRPFHDLMMSSLTERDIMFSNLSTDEAMATWILLIGTIIGIAFMA